MQMQETQNRQASLKKNKVGRLILSDFKAQCTATVIKTLWCQHGNRCKDQWNTTVGLELNLYLKPFSKINSEQITDKNMTTTSVNLLVENLGVNLCDLRLRIITYK